MRKPMIMLAACALSLVALAKGVEQVSIVENEIATINVPFGITSYLPSNMDVVRIEEVSGTSLRITALRRGRCDLDVRGDKDLSQKYEITVLGDLATTLDSLNSELDQVQEVRARVIGDFIRIDGEVGSIQKWEYLQKVLRNYPGVVRNFAIFSPGPDVMLRLKETLQEAGFTVAFQSPGKDRKAWPANQIALVLNKNTRIMSVQGRVYTPEQSAKVAECLSTERWLTTDVKPVADAYADDGRIRAQIDVFVDCPQIRVSVAYMAIGDEDVKKIGNSAAALGDGAFNMLGALSTAIGIGRDRGGPTTRSGSHAASIGASLDITSRFLRKNGITRISDTGYTVMESWSKDGATFKSGGTVYAKTMQANGSGGDSIVMGNGTLEKIPYGFQLSTKGGVVREGNAVDLAIDFEYSSVSQNDYEDYELLEKKSKQKLVLPLGRTTFLGGIKMLDENRVSPSGVPFLRSTPILNWFVADSGTEINDKKLVIMICPEIVDNTKDGTLEVEREINIPVPTEGAKSTEQREDEKRPFAGGLWNPLNWFAY
jgi:hypothetical protein